MTSVAGSSSGLSDLSEETPPQRKSSSAATARSDDKSGSLSGVSKRAMTPEEKKKHKELVSEKYFKLMEKYGPKRRFLQTSDQSASEDQPHVEPVGFVIKFRLSHAYKALEKQEIEAAIPDIKPVRKRKRTKFLLPHDHRSEAETPVVAAGASAEGTTGSGTSTTTRTRAARRVQIRIRGPEKENARGVWQTLTRQKASPAMLLKEKQQREVREQDLKVGKGQRQSGQGQPNVSQGQASPKLGQRQTNQKQSNLKQGKVGESGGKTPRGRSDVSQERQRAIERSLVQVRADTKQRQNRKSREMWDSHFQGIGGMGLPGSVGAATTEYSSGDSVFRMFSDSAFSGSITMDAVTMTASRPSSRPSSPSKSLLLESGSRPSSGRRVNTPKPRTSTPARPASPTRPHTARVRTPAANVRTPNERRRAQSATPPSGKGANDTTLSGKGKNRSISAILRIDGQKEKKNAEKDGGDVKVLAPRKISKYLYHMCNCHQVGKKDTLSKLYKKKNVAGVIDVYGCPDTRDPRAGVLFCPFCSVIPQRRINAWLDNLEDE